MKPTIKDVQDIVNKIINALSPEAILLFGSLAKGHVSEDSDIDLLVVWNDHTELTHSKRRQMLRKAIGLVAYPIDLLTYTSEEIKLAYEDENSFTHSIINESEVLYGRLSLTGQVATKS